MNKIAIASFHPKTASAPYIQSGTDATLDTMLRFASTKAASASRLKRCSSERSLVGVRSVNAVMASKATRSYSDRWSWSSVDAEGSVGRREGVEGAMVAKRGSSARV